MNSIEKKIENLKKIFCGHCGPEKKYQKIIELGKSLPKLSTEKKVSENLVQGCQSKVFLHSYMSNGNIYFEAEADALISSGLAALLIFVYSGEAPETILKAAPVFLDELGIANSLTPNRANGLHSIHLRMKQDAISLLCKAS